MRRFRAVVMLGVLAFVGCAGDGSSVPDGAESLGNSSWQLIDESPDGRQLLIEPIRLDSPNGPCVGVTDWTLDQTEDRVAVSRLLWANRVADTGCSSSAEGGFFLVELDEPLGERTLEGCRRAEDCRMRLNSSSFDPLRVEAIDRRFVVSTNAGPVAIDADGDVEVDALAESLFESAEWDMALDRRRTPSTTR